MQSTIHLAFVDDWELSCDGSGDPHALQFAPMRRLVEIYNAHNVRGSFNAEVLQQLTFRQFQEQHPELKAPRVYRRAIEMLQQDETSFQNNDGSGKRYYVMSKLFQDVAQQSLSKSVPSSEFRVSS